MTQGGRERERGREGGREGGRERETQRERERERASLPYSFDASVLRVAFESMLLCISLTVLHKKPGIMDVLSAHVLASVLLRIRILEFISQRVK